MKQKFIEYFRSDPLPDLIRDLADTAKYPDARSSGVDAAILSLVQRFTLELTGCAEALHSIPGRGESTDEERTDAAMKVAFLAEENFQKLEFTRGVPFLSMDSLGDTRASAALVREIAFGSDYALDRDTAECVDLGTGSGVLLLGGIISGLRKGAKRVICHGVDRSAPLLKKAEKTLGMIPEAEIHLHQADLNDDAAYDQLPSHAHMWISETIGFGTPQIAVENDGRMRAMEKDQSHEPFPVVMEKLSGRFSDFVSRIRDGKAALFPDVVNGHYQPEKEAILLKTSSPPRHTLLGEIGNDFWKYQTLLVRSGRWL